MTSSVLVTGAGGFIGSTLLRMAAAGVWPQFRFASLGSRPVGAFPWIDDRRDEGGRYGFLSADFISAGISHIDYVLHLGAFTPKSADQGNNVSKAIANVSNVSHLVSNLPNPPRRFVFASSLDVYAPAKERIKEEGYCVPASLYGWSKLFGEKIVAELIRKTPPTELQILRVGHTYGPGEERYQKFIPNAIRQVQMENRMSFRATGDERRAFIFSEDCCRLLVSALVADPPTGPINIASRTVRSLMQVADTLAGIHEEISGVRPPITWREGDPPPAEVVPAVSLMEQLLGVEATSLHEGLRREYLSQWELLHEDHPGS